MDERLDAVRFALMTAPRARRLTALLRLARRPADLFAILRAAVTGKRLRARQRLATVIGFDHRRLWRRELAAASATGVRPSTAKALAQSLPAPHPDAPASAGLEGALQPPPTDPGASVEAASRRRKVRGAGGISAIGPGITRPAAPLDVQTPPPILLTAPGHSLLPGAAERMAAALTADPSVQALYGDALLQRGEREAMPLLRPAFDPDYLMAVDYIGPVAWVRASAAEAVGATGAFDLLLRIADRFGADAIRHAPGIVSVWRPGEAGPPMGGARAARLRAARASLHRQGSPDARAEIDAEGIITIVRPPPEPAPLVSLIVPTRDRLDLLAPCVDSLLARTDWPNTEILICDNDSREPETLAYFRALEARGAARIIACPGPFNFAAMNNRAAEVARGRLLAFVNNDVEAFQPDWLARMAREALRPDVGAVGAKLLDREGRVQHAGIILGTGGLVTHGHRHFPGDAPGYLSGLRATRQVSAVTAACLVVEAETFARVGGFDAGAFAVDFNDVDLCLRLNEAGFRTLLAAGAVLHHREASSRRWTDAALARHQGEVEALKKRWGPQLALDPHYHPGFDPDLGSYAALRRGVTEPDAGRRSGPSRSRT